MADGGLRVAYLTGEYPRATDAWIQREIASLRDHGVEVDTFAVRRPDEGHMVGPEQRGERERTTYLFDQLRSPAPFLAHARLAVTSPRRYRDGLKLMWQTRRPGLQGTALQLAYFIEAGLLAAQVRKRRLAHLHNHFGDSSCTVAMLASALGGFSYSFTLHGPGIFFEPNEWRLDAKIARAAFVACISWFCRSQAAIFAHPDHVDRLRIVHCGVDPTRYKPVEHVGAGTRLLFVGRLAGVKGLPVLLEALPTVAAVHPDVTLSVIGDGPERDRFESDARRLGVADRVDFAGYKSQEDVAGQLGETDVFVLPSFAEGVPVTLMEAMASGVPVVATQVGGVTELVADGVNGFVVRPGDQEQLASRLIALIGDPERRQRYGEAGRTTVESEFANPTEAARLKALFADEGAPIGVRPSLGQ